MDSNNSLAKYQKDEGIDLIELWNICLEGKWVIIGITAVFSLGSVIYALAQTNIFRSEALLAPAEARQTNNPLVSQLGLAAGLGLVGINVGSANSSQIKTVIATMKSRSFITQFIGGHEILVPLMAEKWNEKLNASVIDQSIYDEESGGWLKERPTAQLAYETFSSILSISESRDSALVTVAVEWHDPVQAQQWVSWLVDDINVLVKELEMEEATNAIDYLQRQLKSTQLVEMKNAFYQLIEAQIRIIMLADVRSEYVFRTIDPAYVPEEKVRPVRSTICMLGTFFGGMLAVIIVFIRHAYLVHKNFPPP